MSVEQLRRISFRVHGIPVTQGSLNAFMPRDKKTGRPLTRFPIVTHSNKPQLRSWRDAIASEALRARPGGILDGPVVIICQFHLPRPRSMPSVLRTEKQRARWTWPWRRPDLDKLERALLDALKGILLRDDAQVCRVIKEKIFSSDPGLNVVIMKLDELPKETDDDGDSRRGTQTAGVPARARAGEGAGG